MNKKITFSVFVFFICFSSVLSQAKVGTVDAHILNMSPSVKSIGMGGAGAAIVNSNSFFYNPATLGLYLSENNMFVSTYPGSSKIRDDLKFFNLSVGYPLYHKKGRVSNFYIGGAYSYNKISQGPFVERTYQQGTVDGSGIFFWEDITHNFAFSFATTGKVDYGFGVTFKYIYQSEFSNRDNNFCFDFGGILRYYFDKVKQNKTIRYINPAFSVAFRNIGPSIKSFSSEYPLPKITSFGASLETGLRKDYSENESARIYNLIPTINFEKDFRGIWSTKYGVEFSLVEIINLRIGGISNNELSSDETTIGFSISTFNFGKFGLLVSGDKNEIEHTKRSILFNKLNIEYNFAKYNRYQYPTAQNYHELVFILAI